MSSTSNGVSRRSLMTATALASLAAVTGCGGGGSSAAAPVPGSPPPPPPPPAPVTSKYLYSATGTNNTIGAYAISQSDGSLSGLLSPVGATPTDPMWIASHPNGRWIYVTTDDGSITQYTVGTSGQLTIGAAMPITTTSGASFFSPIEFHPDGNLMYVGNVGPGSISTFAIDSTTGALSVVFSGTGTGLQNSQFFLKVHPSKRFIYVSYVNGDIAAYPLSTTNGAVDTTVAPASTFVLGTSQLVFNAAGTYGYTTSSTGPSVASFQWNSGTGQLTSSSVGGTYGAFGPSNRLLMHPSGNFLIGNSTGSADVIVFPVTSGGVVSAGVNTTASGNTTSIALNKDGTILYAGTAASGNRVNVFSVTTAGVLTLISSGTTGANPVSLAVANL